MNTVHLHELKDENAVMIQKLKNDVQILYNRIAIHSIPQKKYKNNKK